MTDLQSRTTLEGLYACGEAACTGVHGANRLASNSLLEALVFGKRSADDALARTDLPAACTQVPAFPGQTGRVGTLDHALVAALRHRLQTVMQKYVGIVRSDSRLQKARTAVHALRAEAQPLFDGCVLADDVLELRNMIEVAGLIIACAQKRKESRGLHYTTDYPQTLESERHDTILVPDAGPV